MNEPNEKDVATRAAEALQEKFTIGTSSQICDENDFDNASTEDIAVIVRDCIYSDKVLSELWGKHLQDEIDNRCEQDRLKRASTQMTLGKLIDRLESMSPIAMVQGIEQPHSYRGYYSDLAFERAERAIYAQDALKLCYSVLGGRFGGYRGGECLMGRDAPIWIANLESRGQKVIDLGDGGVFELADDNF